MVLDPGHGIDGRVREAFHVVEDVLAHPALLVLQLDLAVQDALEIEGHADGASPVVIGQPGVDMREYPSQAMVAQVML